MEAMGRLQGHIQGMLEGNAPRVMAGSGYPVLSSVILSLRPKLICRKDGRKMKKT